MQQMSFSKENISKLFPESEIEKSSWFSWNYTRTENVHWNCNVNFQKIAVSKLITPKPQQSVIYWRKCSSIDGKKWICKEIYSFLIIVQGLKTCTKIYVFFFFYNFCFEINCTIINQKSIIYYRKYYSIDGRQQICNKIYNFLLIIPGWKKWNLQR